MVQAWFQLCQAERILPEFFSAQGWFAILVGHEAEPWVGAAHKILPALFPMPISHFPPISHGKIVSDKVVSNFQTLEAYLESFVSRELTAAQSIEPLDNDGSKSCLIKKKSIVAFKTEPEKSTECNLKWVQYVCSPQQPSSLEEKLPSQCIKKHCLELFKRILQFCFIFIQSYPKFYSILSFSGPSFKLI